MNFRAFFLATLFALIPIVSWAQAPVPAPIDTVVVNTRVLCVNKDFFFSVHTGFDIPVSVGITKLADGRALKTVTVAKDSGEFLVYLVRPDNRHCMLIGGAAGIVSKEVEVLPGTVH